jgi:hypothetical protein
MMRKSAVIAVAISIVGLVALAATMFARLGDLGDQYEVLSSEKDPTSDQHVVTFSFYHSNSSNTVSATWITQAPRELGSAERPSGQFALMWRGLKSVSPTWVQGRLTLIVPPGTELRGKDSSDCYFEYDQSPIVCFDSKLATVVRQ